MIDLLILMDCLMIMLRMSVVRVMRMIRMIRMVGVMSSVGSVFGFKRFFYGMNNQMHRFKHFFQNVIGFNF